jgi:DNA repair exonuclease SbcCD nuclease subunit
LHIPKYRTEPTDEYTVAVGYGSADADALAEGRFDYWALGGKHNRQEIDGGAEAGAVYCGSPQGRSLSEAGPHGYTVVDVDAEETTRIHRIECDTVRYCQVEIDGSEIASVGSIQSLLGERIGRLQHEHSGRHLIIGWDISLSGGETLQTIGDAEDLLQWVRREYGHGNPSAWTARLNVRPPRAYPQNWHDEETILGDFLRIAGDHRQADARDLNLLPFTEEHEDLLATTVNLLGEVSATDRMEVLDQATLLGVELLRGGKPKLVQKS